MLADAVSLWSSATSAVYALNENFNSALEQFETENIKPNDEVQNNYSVEHLQCELELYKSMLETSQMQHLELSKQSRFINISFSDTLYDILILISPPEII